MRIISFSFLRKFIADHADANVSLREWYKKTQRAEWRSLQDVRRTFNSADYVGNDHYVFNIHGNKYRLVALIFFQVQKVYVRWIGTHAEYDNIKVNEL